MQKIERYAVSPDLLRAFVAVAQHRNLTRAAEGLGRTQSAVSVQLRRLEGRLGARLFRREARGMTLTADGLRLLPAAERVLRDLERIGAMFRTTLAGPIRVGIPDDYGTAMLQRILRRFADRHPEVEVTVRCGFSPTFPRAVRDGDLDLAVHACAPDEAAEPVFEEAMVWAAAADWPKAPAPPVPLALFDRDCWWRDLALAALTDAGLAHNVVLTSESAWGVKAAISSGMAVGILGLSTLEPGMQALGPADGWPALPASRLAVLRSPQADGRIAAAMEAAIRDGFGAAPA
ncbi:LysR family transcriptional regulator [Marinibaculum pumilum]|uniref:LysR family transcriptional regulator n=1 Tax=Marinibaculum pumilum TaxID=1766165 RepID=A0ABV7L3N0_9PROT